MAGETEAQKTAHNPQQVGEIWDEIQVSGQAAPALPLGLLVLQVSMSFGAQGPPWGQLLRVHDAEFILSAVSQDRKAGRAPKSRIWGMRTGALGERGCCQ